MSLFYSLYTFSSNAGKYYVGGFGKYWNKTKIIYFLNVAWHLTPPAGITNVVNSATTAELSTRQ